MLLNELLEIVPADTEKRVVRARDRFNQNVREAIRQETGLRFRPKGQSGDLQPTEFISIPVRVMPGMPVALRQRKIDESKRLAALLAPWRRTLEELNRSSLETRESVLPIIPPGVCGESGWGHLAGAAMLAEKLLHLIRDFDLAAWILEVNEDVLGAYMYQVLPAIPAERLESHIEIYWAIVGLMAQILGVSVEALTVVVLAHELGHAYTHRAADIDGDAWTASAFANSEHALKEGLAQYYTARVCDRLAVSMPDAKLAYAELLKHQPAAYKTHEPWIEDHKPEEVRFALVIARREREMSLEGFEIGLSAARSQLRDEADEE
jgi:hypothetical protein